MKASERLEQIRRAHKSAEPKPAVNPAWANTHRDLGFCLSVIESQAKAMEEMRGALLYIALEMPPQETASRIAAEMAIKAEAPSQEGEQG